MRVAFIHPDLGIGGAERLVVDAAVGLQNRGHEVIIYTSHCDRSHCFEEVKSGLLKVEVRGDFLPTNIGGKFSIVCAAARQMYLTYDLIRSNVQHDVYIVDQLSHCVPLLREFMKQSRILFYCHFPDQRLSKRTSLLKKIYRIPFDYLEQWSTDQSDVIVVNSNFTKGVFKSTFASIKRQPDVIYPCVDTEQDLAPKKSWVTEKLNCPYFLSVNRFERSKDIDLAVDAYSCLCDDPDLSDELTSKLIIAGGYDPRVSENVEYLKELLDKVGNDGLVGKVYFKEDLAKPDVSFDGVNVLFFPSISSELKNSLLSNAQVLLYTPTNEHFGIVPLESMLVGTPVIATNTGGPRETIVDGVTGWNRPRDREEWAKVMYSVLTGTIEGSMKEMAKQGHERVIKTFSQEHMAEQFEAKLKQALALEERPEKSKSLGNIFTWILIILLAIVVASVSAWLK